MKLKILVAEDEELARRNLSMLLEESGFDVVEARDGVEAVRLATRELPNVILMDIAMPIMDGFEAAERIRDDSRTTRIPIIACTGVPRPLDEFDGLFQSVINKPFASKTVVAEVQRFVSSR